MVRTDFNLFYQENISMNTAIIYHNPKCSTSRNALALLRHVGIEPTIIHYLDTPPDETMLRDLLAKMQRSPREIMRTDVDAYSEHSLNDTALSDDILISTMVREPSLINRPIVVTDKGVRLCRPLESLLEILPVPLMRDFIKENGDIIAA